MLSVNNTGLETLRVSKDSLPFPALVNYNVCVLIDLSLFVKILGIASYSGHVLGLECCSLGTVPQLVMYVCILYFTSHSQTDQCPIM